MVNTVVARLTVRWALREWAFEAITANMNPDYVILLLGLARSQVGQGTLWPPLLLAAL